MNMINIFQIFIILLMSIKVTTVQWLHSNVDYGIRIPSHIVQKRIICNTKAYHMMA